MIPIGEKRSKMLAAIHKETNKPVTAFAVAHSLTWINKDPHAEEFIAPRHEIGNWIELERKGITEVKVCFVKQHQREDEIVCDHFRIITEGAVENPDNESEEHKLAKETLYDKIIKDEVILLDWEGKRISEVAKIKDVYIERPVGQKRADVLVDFEEIHPVLGRGIAFEIQISPQNDIKTYKRTYDRAAQGYSICWIWSWELPKFNYKVRLIHFTNALDEYQQQIEQRTKQFFSDTTVRFTRFERDMFNNISSHAESTIRSMVESIKEAARRELRSANEDISKLKALSEQHIVKINQMIQTNSTDVQKVVKANVAQATAIDAKEIERQIEEKIGQHISQTIEKILPSKIDIAILTRVNTSIQEALDKSPLINTRIVETLSTALNERLKTVNFDTFTRDNLVMCLKCSDCGVWVPVVDVYSKDLKKYCRQCFYKSAKSEVNNGESTKGQSTLA